MSEMKTKTYTIRKIKEKLSNKGRQPATLLIFKISFLVIEINL